MEDIILMIVVFMMAVMAYMLLLPIHIITGGKFLKRPISRLRKFILYVVDPVCQDEKAKMYCLYDGDQGRWISCRDKISDVWSAPSVDYEKLVKLIPFREDPNDISSRISNWKPDPKEIQRLGLAMPSKRFVEPKGPSKSVFVAILCFLGRKLVASLAFIDQNPNEFHHGSFNGRGFIEFVPVMNPDNPLRIDDWVPDPFSVRLGLDEGEVVGKVVKKYDFDWAQEGFDLMNDGKEENDDKSSVQKSKNGTCKPDAKIVSIDSFIAIDGSNVICYGDEKCNGVRGTKVLSALVNSLVGNGYQCRVFLDGSMIGRLKHKEHDEAGLEYLQDGEKKGWVLIAPGKSEADGQILQLAEFEKNVHIITNDRYRDYGEIHPWLNDGNAENRLHGINVVPMWDGQFRILVAGFNLDITVRV